MEKKTVIVLSMVLFILSANMDAIKSDVFDCYDACSTGCVNSDNRLMTRCDRKCQIRCSPDLEANKLLT